jgi:hypothetical protein
MLQKRIRRTEERHARACDVEARRARRLTKAQALASDLERRVAVFGASEGVDTSPTLDPATEALRAYCMREKRWSSSPIPRRSSSPTAAVSGACPGCGAHVVTTVRSATVSLNTVPRTMAGPRRPQQSIDPQPGRLMRAGRRIARQSARTRRTPRSFGRAAWVAARDHPGHHPAGNTSVGTRPEARPCRAPIKASSDRADQPQGCPDRCKCSTDGEATRRHCPRGWRHRPRRSPAGSPTRVTAPRHQT